MKFEILEWINPIDDLFIIGPFSKDSDQGKAPNYID
jgi:hypothetical protein